MISISGYTSVFSNDSFNLTLHDFYKGVKNGRWMDDIIDSRRTGDKKFKTKSPNVTISGTFRYAKMLG